MDSFNDGNDNRIIIEPNPRWSLPEEMNGQNPLPQLGSELGPTSFRSVFMTAGNDEFLADVADAAVPTLTPDSVESVVRIHKDRNPELRVLMERSLYGWVGLAAIVAIAGW